MPDPVSVTAGTYALIAILGLVFGSFMNVVIHRLPQRLEHQWRRDCHELLSADHPGKQEPETKPPGLILPGSHCPHCKTPIRIQHNIPVLSYLFLRGRCAYCGAAIGIRYPAVEILTALVACVVLWRYGLTVTGIAAAVLSLALIALTFIDYDHHLLPDIITLPGLWLGLTCNLFGMFSPLSQAVVGALAGYLCLWLLYHGFRLVTGKEGMGYGDFKLLAMLGAWLGWPAIPVIIILGAGVGSLLGITLMALKVVGRDSPLPFGPFLAAAGWVVLIWGDSLIPRLLPFLYF